MLTLNGNGITDLLSFGFTASTVLSRLKIAVSQSKPGFATMSLVPIQLKKANIPNPDLGEPAKITASRLDCSRQRFNLEYRVGSSLKLRYSCKKRAATKSRAH
jgi:hypothetical protein